jgi:hypothetical protein
LNPPPSGTTAAPTLNKNKHISTVDVAPGR